MTVDVMGIIVFLLFLVLYYSTKRKYTIFLFISGIGAGMVIAAIWFTVQIQMMDFTDFLQ